MKKGIQYSHYCGTELLELINSAWLMKDDLKNGQKESAQMYADHIVKLAEMLRDKIAELDKINEMKY